MFIVFLCIYCAKFFCDNELLPPKCAQIFSHTQLTVTVINIDRFTFINVSDQICRKNDQNECGPTYVYI